MKNSHLKNSLIAAGIAVFAGVVTLGANVAISATTPTQTPAAAGLVGPTFSTATIGGILNVAGLIQNTVGGIVGIKGPVDISGAIRNDTVVNTPVIFNDGNGVALQAGDLDIQQGGILNSNGILNIKSSIDINGQIRNDTVAGAPVSFNDANGVALKAGDLDIQAGVIKNSLGSVSFGSAVGFTKSTFFEGASNIFNTGLQINGGLTMGGLNRVITNVLQINGDDVSTFRLQQPSVWMELKPNVSARLYTASGSSVSTQNTGEVTVIGKNVYGKNLNNEPTFTVTGKDFASAGEVKAATWLKTKDFQSTGALWSDGSAYFKHLDVFNEGVGDVFMENGNIKATGDLTIGKNVNDQKFLVHTRPNGNGDFLQITTDKADGNWDWSNGIIMKRATAEGSPSTQFHVNGKVTSATGFGTYTFRESIYKTLGANATGYVYASCNAGEQIISCYGNAYSSVPTVGNFYSGEIYDVNMTALYPYNGQCEANYKNTTGSNRYIKSGALCLNPSL